MSERTKHLFEFSAEKIAAAAKAEADYHRDRLVYWKAEHEKSKRRVMDSAKLEFREYAVTGGTRMDMQIHYGDPGSHARMHESWDKMTRHRAAMEAFATDADVYGSQGGRLYQLDAADVLHFRLGGGPREE